MQCLNCQQEMSDEQERCSHCGWSYLDGQDDTEIEKNSLPVCTHCFAPYTLDQKTCLHCGNLLDDFKDGTRWA